MKNKYIKYIFLIPILIWMIVIFHFSNDNAEVSDSKSSKVAEKVVEVITTEETPIAKKQEMVKKTNPIVRKIAHYSLYALGGLLIIIFVDRLNIKDVKKVLYSFLVGSIYASIDEIHQMFIPGRTQLITDVLLDSLGVLTGLLFYLLCREIYVRVYNKKTKINNKKIVS